MNSNAFLPVRGLSMRRNLERLLALACLLALLFFPGSAAAQASSGVSMSAEAGFDGYCKDGHWIPVRVLVENQGEGIQGRLEILIQGTNNRETTYAQEVSLPSVSRKEVTLYVYPDGYLSDLTLRLVSAGREIANETLPLTCAGGTGALYGVLAPSLTSFNILAEVTQSQGRALVAQLEPAGLPDQGEALRALDLLVISGVDTGLLEPAQRTALSSWVAGGGRLLVTGGPDWKKTSAGLSDLLPFVPLASQTLEEPTPQAGNSGASGSQDDLPGDLVIATGEPAQGAVVLYSRSGLPLVIAGSYGSGWVYYLAFDPSLEPLRSWDGLQDFYRDLLQSEQVRPAWPSGFQDWYLAANAAGTLPGMELPPAWSFLGFLGFYVLAIGPANYLILRRFKRRELAWISIPILVIVFSSLAFLAGSGLRGARPVLNRLAVVRVWPDAGQARVDGLLGVFSPGRNVYQLEVGRDFLVHNIPSQFTASQNSVDLFRRDEQGRTQAPDLRVDIGGIQVMALEGQAAAPEFSHQLQLELGQEGALLRGWVENHSDLTLEDAVLLISGGAHALGDLPPGERREVRIDIGETSRAARAGDGTNVAFPGYGLQPGGPLMSELLGTQDFYRDRETYRRYSLVSALTGYLPGAGNLGSGALLAGWSESSPLEARLIDEEFNTSDTSLYLIALDPQRSTQDEPLTLPPGLFTWSVGDPGQTGEASPYETFLNPGGYSLRFKPPFPLRYTAVESLTLRLESYGARGPSGVQAQLWDFTIDEWEDLPPLDWGEHRVENPERFVGPGGEIRLRLDNTGSFGPLQIERSDFVLTVR